MRRKHNLPPSPLAPRQLVRFDFADPQQSRAAIEYLRERLGRLARGKRAFPSEFDRLLAPAEAWCRAVYAEAGMAPNRAVPNDLYPQEVWYASQIRSLAAEIRRLREKEPDLVLGIALTLAENLRSGTWRHRYQNSFPVVDVGLRLHQVDGLEDEPISPDNLKSVGDDRLRACGAGEDEIAFLRRRRVELNALTTEQLVNLVEGALVENNVAKIVPSDKDLGNAWRAAKAHAEVAEAVEEANRRAERWHQADAPDDLADQIRVLLENHPTMPWHAALRRIAGSAP